MVDKACKKCKRITSEKKCPVCGSQELTNRFRGVVVIFNVEKSEIAKEMHIEIPGEYALKVR